MTYRICNTCKRTFSTRLGRQPELVCKPCRDRPEDKPRLVQADVEIYERLWKLTRFTTVPVFNRVEHNKAIEKHLSL